MKRFFVYILASRPGGTLYIGVTSDLARRVHEHRTGAVPGFTLRYNVRQLVHVEPFETAMDAIQREKSLKRWPRAWKTRLLVKAIQPGVTSMRKWPEGLAELSHPSLTTSWPASCRPSRPLMRFHESRSPAQGRG